MSANSSIEWTDHTFNPWIGCTKVSPGCVNCYAETRDKRHLQGPVDHWGKGAPRARTSAANWRQPLAWNRGAERLFDRHGAPTRQRRARVFCASMADWLDEEVPIEWLADLLELIHATPNLDWQLLTKRPENWRRRIEAVLKFIEARPEWETAANDSPMGKLRNFLADWFVLRLVPKNVWIGVSVEDQVRATERIPALMEIPAWVRFLSCEPLLGRVDLERPRPGPDLGREGSKICQPWYIQSGIHWVICGGESGAGARAMHPDWARALRDQCVGAGVPFFFKQWGEWWPLSTTDGRQILPWGEYDTETGFGFLKKGKKGAGRVLDGREWNEIPASPSRLRSAAPAQDGLRRDEAGEICPQISQINADFSGGDNR